MRMKDLEGRVEVNSVREVRFWPLLLGVYAIVWGLASLLRGVPIEISLDRISVMDLAIFGIVVGVWLVTYPLQKRE